MSLFKYELFMEVVESNSFTKAAEKLNITQSAVSHGIKSLENELGFQLFIRDTKEIKLTKPGEEIIRYVNSLLAADRRLQNKINSINNIEAGQLTIGSFGSSSTKFLPDIVKRFNDLYPNIELFFREGGYSDILNWLKDDVADVAFLVEELIDDQMYSTPYFSDEILALLPKEYGLGSNDYFDIKDVVKYPYILSDLNPHKYLQILFKRYDIKPYYKYTVNMNPTVFAMVEKGLGLTLLPESTLYKSIYDIDVLPLKQRVFRKIHLVTKKGHQRNPIVKAFFKIANELRQQLI
ncbi:MAG: LysR family transcriptional regulator [Bacillota bacterium]